MLHKLNAKLILIRPICFKAVFDRLRELLVHLLCLLDLVKHLFFKLKWDVFCRAIVYDWFDYQWCFTLVMAKVDKCWRCWILQIPLSFKSFNSFDFTNGMWLLNTKWISCRRCHNTWLFQKVVVFVNIKRFADDAIVLQKIPWLDSILTLEWLKQIEVFISWKVRCGIQS